MDDVRNRLVNCFKIAFPGLEDNDIPNANQESVSAWDSIGAITLMNVIEEEFDMQMDFDRVADLDSFSKIHDYLKGV